MKKKATNSTKSTCDQWDNCENFTCFTLDWDSDYFNVKAGKVILKNEVSKETMDNLKSELKKFEFITIYNINNNNLNNHWICGEINAVLVDINIQYVKKISKPENELEDFNDIEIQSNYEYNTQVVEIANEEFKYSRFYNDDNLSKLKSEEIYLNWIKNSFNKENKFFILPRDNDKIQGFILFSVDRLSNSIVIELIAVSKNYQGIGIGGKMIKALEKYGYDNNVGFIKVGTQLNNIEANNFYQRNGFKYSNCSSIYHWWNKKTN